MVRKWSRKGVQGEKCAGQSAKYRWVDVIEHRGQCTGGGGWVRSWVQRLGFGLGVGCWRAVGGLGADGGVRLWVPVKDKLDGETWDLGQAGVSEWG